MTCNLRHANGKALTMAILACLFVSLTSLWFKLKYYIYCMSCLEVVHIHSPQRMNKTAFGYSVTFFLAPPQSSHMYIKKKKDYNNNLIT